MLQGKVTSALNYFSSKRNGGVLHLDDLVPETTSNDETKMRSTRDILNDKYPKGRAPPSSTLVEGTAEPTNPILFDGLNANTILQAAMHTHARSSRPFWFGCTSLAMHVLIIQISLNQSLHRTNRCRQVDSNHSNPSRGLECSCGLSPYSSQ